VPLPLSESTGRSDSRTTVVTLRPTKDKRNCYYLKRVASQLGFDGARRLTPSCDTSPTQLHYVERCFRGICGTCATTKCNPPQRTGPVPASDRLPMWWERSVEVTPVGQRFLRRQRSEELVWGVRA